MSEYSNIEFEVPQFLIHHYYISGAIAVVFNCLVIYFLIFHSGRIGSFKFYLLGFQARLSGKRYENFLILDFMCFASFPCDSSHGTTQFIANLCWL